MQLCNFWDPTIKKAASHFNQTKEEFIDELKATITEANVSSYISKVDLLNKMIREVLHAHNIKVD